MPFEFLRIAETTELSVEDATVFQVTIKLPSYNVLTNGLSASCAKLGVKLQSHLEILVLITSRGL